MSKLENLKKWAEKERAVWEGNNADRYWQMNRVVGEIDEAINEAPQGSAPEPVATAEANVGQTTESPAVASPSRLDAVAVAKICKSPDPHGCGYPNCECGAPSAHAAKVRIDQGGEPITMKQAADAIKHAALDKMVDRFLAWPLPDSVRSDTCVTMVGGDLYRSGTNLLTADEAWLMFEYVVYGK